MMLDDKDLSEYKIERILQPILKFKKSPIKKLLHTKLLRGGNLLAI